MTIVEYYNNYKLNKSYPISLPTTASDKSIKDFYDNMVSKHLLPTQNVIAWHNMFVKYVKRPNPIVWIRRYESGNKNNGKWNTRRGCVVKYNNITIVYVSNYDAHEIFNMIRLGVTPDIDEFTRLMTEHLYPLHYKTGNSCEESLINSYPLIGNVYGGILTPNHLYLAHINDVNGKYLHADGSYSKLSDSEIDALFPRGIPANWQINSNGFKTYNIKRSLSQDELDMVIAHFLRFVDPLNYYITPSDKYHFNSTGSRISNDKDMNGYVEFQYACLFGKGVVDEFKQLALIPFSSFSVINKDIDITYGNTKSGNFGNNKTTNHRVVSQDVSIHLNPSDLSAFKQALLAKRMATITLTYDSGNKKTSIWNAKKFDASSGVMNNIKSKPFWRKRAEEGLALVEITVI